MLGSITPETGDQAAVESNRKLEQNMAEKEHLCIVECKFKGEDNGEEMIECEICEGWYHLVCLDLNEKDTYGIWLCPQCKTTWINSLDKEKHRRNVNTCEHCERSSEKIRCLEEKIKDQETRIKRLEEMVHDIANNCMGNVEVTCEKWCKKNILRLALETLWKTIQDDNCGCNTDDQARTKPNKEVESLLPIVNAIHSVVQLNTSDWSQTPVMDTAADVTSQQEHPYRPHKSSSLKEKLKHLARFQSSPLSPSSKPTGPRKDMEQSGGDSGENLSQLNSIPQKVEEEKNSKMDPAVKANKTQIHGNNEELTDLEKLKAQYLEHEATVAKKEEIIRKLKMVKTYRLKNDPDKLCQLVLKWRAAAQEALQDLHQHMPEPRKTMTDLITHLDIPYETLGYNPEEECFE